MLRRRFWPSSLLFIVALASCSGRSAELRGVISANADRGIKEILNMYGGRCEYGLAVRGGEKLFWVRLSQSNVVNKYARTPRLPASGIAYLLFRNLGAEQSKYNKIRSVIVDASGAERQFEFATDSMMIVRQKYQALERAAKLIGDGDFDGLENSFAHTLTPEQQALVRQRLVRLQPQLGRVDSVKPFGFLYFEDEDGPQVHLAAILFREKGEHPFSVDLSLRPGLDSIRMLNYQL
jgi:hypothetical protein